MPTTGLPDTQVAEPLTRELPSPPNQELLVPMNADVTASAHALKTVISRLAGL
jgi:hypothetical protein